MIPIRSDSFSRCQTARSSLRASPMPALSKPPAFAASIPAWASSTTRQAIRRSLPYHLGCFQEHFRMRLGVRDAVPIRYRVKETSQPDTFKYIRRVLAGRPYREFQIRSAQFVKRLPDVIAKIRGGHPAEQFAVQRVLLFRERGLLRVHVARARRRRAVAASRGWSPGTP